MTEEQITGLERCIQKIKGLIQRGKFDGLKPKKTNISKGTIFHYNYVLVQKKANKSIDVKTLIRYII